mgnify:CR=1 FL=1
MHALQMDLKSDATKEEILAIIEAHPRMGLVRPGTGITSTAELREYAQDLGRPAPTLRERHFRRLDRPRGRELFLSLGDPSGGGRRRRVRGVHSWVD